MGMWTTVGRVRQKHGSFGVQKWLEDPMQLRQRKGYLSVNEYVEQEDGHPVGCVTLQPSLAEVPDKLGLAYLAMARHGE